MHPEGEDPACETKPTVRRGKVIGWEKSLQFGETYRGSLGERPPTPPAHGPFQAPEILPGGGRGTGVSYWAGCSMTGGVATAGMGGVCVTTSTKAGMAINANTPRSNFFMVIDVSSSRHYA